MKTMKPIGEVYAEHAKDYSDGSFYGPSDYMPMLESMGHEILLKVDDRDYQGDSRIVFKDGERYGIWIFGWGSCSGCDALQGCESMDEVDELRTRLCDQVKWFDSKEECLKYVNTHDWEGDYSWHQEETREFVSEAKKILGGQTK